VTQRKNQNDGARTKVRTRGLLDAKRKHLSKQRRVVRRSISAESSWF